MRYLVYIGIALKAVGAFFGWREKEAEKDLRDMDREAGRNEQKVADQNEVIRQGHEANAIDAEVGRLPDDELDRRLRKRARPRSKPS